MDTQSHTPSGKIISTSSTVHGHMRGLSATNSRSSQHECIGYWHPSPMTTHQSTTLPRRSLAFRMNFLLKLQRHLMVYPGRCQFLLLSAQRRERWSIEISDNKKKSYARLIFCKMGYISSRFRKDTPVICHHHIWWVLHRHGSARYAHLLEFLGLGET